jgi:hypothetical protein
MLFTPPPVIVRLTTVLALALVVTVKFLVLFVVKIMVLPSMAKFTDVDKRNPSDPYASTVQLVEILLPVNVKLLLAITTLIVTGIVGVIMCRTPTPLSRLTPQILLV